jgi:hypothetical protein
VEGGGMSGSDYTRTPNLGLYKPTPNGDLNSWGAHLNSNSDTLDLLLPLAGGAMTGALALFGVSTAPTPPAGTNTTQIATTAFVASAGFLPLVGGVLAGPGNLTVGGTLTGLGSALFGTGLTGTTNLRVHAADTGSAAVQFYKATGAASGHRWDILTGPASGGALLQALAYDDTGAQRAAALFQANRYSGFGNQGNPWWAIAPFTVGFSRATAPNGNIGADFGGGTGLSDVQPTTILGNNPIAVTSGLANAWITWTGSGAAGGPIGTVNTTSETWVNIQGAAAVGGITVSGWYKATRIDNNSFRIDTGTTATSTATGGGAAVTLQPCVLSAARRQGAKLSTTMVAIRHRARQERHEPVYPHRLGAGPRQSR